LSKIYFSNNKNKDIINRRVKKGSLVRICKNTYILRSELSNIDEIIEENICDIFNILNIRGNIAYSTALTFPKAHNHTYILTGAKAREIKLEHFGIIKIYKANQQESSSILTIARNGTNCTISYLFRAILENYSTRSYDAPKISKKIAQKRLRNYIELSQNDTERLDKLKENLKVTAQKLGYTKEHDEVLKDLLLYEREFRDSFSGLKYDVLRVNKFKELKEILLNHHFVNAPTMNYSNQQEVENLSFFESYFSNYIEGTRFEVNEAVDIMIYKKSYERHADGHDIVIHREITLDKNIRFDFSSEDAFITSLKIIHKKLLEHRGVYAGEFKRKNNQAGDRGFVLVDLVEGTLRYAYRLTQGMPTIQRAILLTIAFLEVHPFEDGNGRLGRLLMNFILQSDGYKRLIIPTVFREDYIMGLKSFTLNSDYKALLRLFERLFDINASIDYNDSIENLISFLDRENAFSDSANGLWGVKENRISDDIDFLGFDFDI